MVEVCLERGYKDTTVAQVIERAGVDRGTFDRHFSDLEDCFTEYIREGRDAFLVEVAAAIASAEGWRNQMRAAGYAMLRFWRADEDRAQMMLVETLSAGDRAQLVRDEGMELMFDVIDQGRFQMSDPEALSRATAEAVGGAVYSQMHLTLVRGELDGGEEMVNQLMFTVVRPYLGTEAALEELDRSAPDSSDR